MSNCEFEEQGSIPENTQNKTEKITVVVYSPWTREVAGSNPASQTKLEVRQRWRVEPV